MTIESRGYEIPDNRRTIQYWQISTLLEEQFSEFPLIPEDEAKREEAKKQLEAFLATENCERPTYTMVQGETFDPNEHGPGTIVKFKKERITFEGLGKDTLTTDDYQDFLLFGVVCNIPIDGDPQAQRGVIVPFIVFHANRQVILEPNPLIAHPIRVGGVFPGRNDLTRINEFSILHEAF